MRKYGYAMMLLAAGPLIGPGPANAEQATKANDFLSSIGVNTKMQQGQGSAGVQAALAYTGVRNVRDSGITDALVPVFNSMHAATGVKFNVLLGSGPSQFAKQMGRAKQLVSGALLSMEGPNEPNNFGVTWGGVTCGKGATSWSCVAGFQKSFYAAMKGDPQLKSVPVFHASEVGAEADNQGLQWATIPAGAHVLQPDGTKYADYTNDHNYICCYKLKDNQAFRNAALDGQGPFDGFKPEHINTWRGHFVGYTQAQAAGVKKVTTETGWYADGTPTHTEADQGKLLLMVYLDQFVASWRYTFVYEVADFGQPGWGFYNDKTNPWTPRLSATYLHNLTTIIADTSSAFNTTAAATTLPGKDMLTHELLLQKSTGPHEFVVWREAVTGSVVQPVNLGASMPSVKVYDPTVGPTPIAMYSNVSSILVTLSDHPLIVEF